MQYCFLWAISAKEWGAVETCTWHSPLQKLLLQKSRYRYGSYGKLPGILYLSAQASIEEYHGLGSLNNRNLFLCHSGIFKSDIKVSVGLFLQRPYLLLLQIAISTLWLHRILPLGSCVSVSSSYKDTNHIGLRPT